MIIFLIMLKLRKYTMNVCMLYCLDSPIFGVCMFGVLWYDFFLANFDI